MLCHAKYTSKRCVTRGSRSRPCCSAAPACGGSPLPSLSHVIDAPDVCAGGRRNGDAVGEDSDNPLTPSTKYPYIKRVRRHRTRHQERRTEVGHGSIGRPHPPLDGGTGGVDGRIPTGGGCRVDHPRRRRPSGPQVRGGFPFLRPKTTYGCSSVGQSDGLQNRASQVRILPPVLGPHGRADCMKTQQWKTPRGAVPKVAG